MANSTTNTPAAATAGMPRAVRVQTAPVNTRTIGDATPLGWVAHAIPMLTFSIYNTGVHHIYIQNAIVAPALFVGGVSLFFAALWSYARGDSLGGLTWASMSGFWFGLGASFVNFIGYYTAFAGNPVQFGRAQGVYFIAWTLFTAAIVIVSYRRTITFMLAFFFQLLSFILLAAANWQNSFHVQKAAGAFGIICAALCWYNAVESLIAQQVTLPNYSPFRRTRKID